MLFFGCIDYFMYQWVQLLPFFMTVLLDFYLALLLGKCVPKYYELHNFLIINWKKYLQWSLLFSVFLSIMYKIFLVPYGCVWNFTCTISCCSVHSRHGLSCTFGCVKLQLYPFLCLNYLITLKVVIRLWWEWALHSFQTQQDVSEKHSLSPKIHIIFLHILPCNFPGLFHVS